MKKKKENKKEENIVRKLKKWIYRISKIDFSVVLDFEKKTKRRFFSKLFMAYSLKKTMKFILLPSNFDYINHIKKFPPQNYGFNDDNNGGFMENRMLFILWQISETASKNEKSWKKDGYVAVSGKTFQKRVQNYKAYMHYLIRTKVIESDEQYEIGVVSIGYRYTSQYRNKPFKVVNLDKTHKEVFDQAVSKYPYLTYWYSQDKFIIDANNAMKEAFGYYDKIKKNEKLWDKDKYGNPKEPYPQYISAISNISKMENKIYNLKLSPKVHRLYSTLTMLPSRYRKFVTYDGSKLYGIDIKNCQSYICCLILNPEFWKPNSKLPLNFYSLPQNVIDLFDDSLFTMIGEKLIDINSPEIFKEYIRVVSNGLIYNDMINWAKIKKGKEVTKNKVKEVVFYTIFSPNGKRKTWLSDYYDEKFEQLIELFDIIKKNNSTVDSIVDTDENSDLEEIEIEETQLEKPHARLAILFQSIESVIVLHRICKRIFIEKDKTVPIFTIHDCIVTTKGNEDYLKQVVVEEFTNCIGYPPPLGIENWI